MHKCQQDELYASEQRLTDRGRVFHTVGDIQRYVDKLRDCVYWQTHYPNVKRVEVHEAGRGARGSVGGFFPELSAGQIEMHRVHFNELYVLHELAHVLAAARYGSQAHCPWFARVYLELVYEYMGSSYYQQLHKNFAADGIDFSSEPSLPMWVLEIG